MGKIFRRMFTKNFRTKVADFGFARLAPDTESGATHILTGAYQDALKFINASLNKLKKMQKKQRMSMLVSLIEIEKLAREVLDVFGLFTTLSYAEVLKEFKLKTLIRAGMGEEDISREIEEKIMGEEDISS